MKNAILSLALVVFATTACSNDTPSRVQASSTAPAPALLESGPTSRSAKTESLAAAEPGREFDSAHRWDLSDPIAVKTLKGNSFGEKEITEFWTKKGWRLTKREDQYMAEVDTLLAAGKVKATTHWAQTPYNGVYQSLEPVTVSGVSVPKGTEFWLEFCENEDELHLGKPLFVRSKDYVEENAGQSTVRR
jgi:hypothetical protein